MTELSNVKSIVMIDGYGRAYETVNPDSVTINLLNEGRVMHIQHNGDTAHSCVTIDEEVEDGTASDRG